MSDAAPTPTPVLMLSTIHAAHAQHSGYSVLARHVPGAELLHAPRDDPQGAALFFARVARRFAFSRWYLGGSASVEWQAARRLRAGFAGVVHSMWADHDLGYLDLFMRRPRQLLCGTFHNCADDFPFTIRFPSRLKNFAAVILMSDSQRSFFQAAGVPDSRIHVVLHGVDTDFFTPEPAASDRPFTALSVGGFRRNFPLLRKVCEQLQNTPGIRFEIVAPAGYREMFRDLANVEFLTGLGDQELLAKYRGASCLLHTAENATANNVVLESMACGIPVVAERIGGIPEYATADCALLTTPGDAGALVEALKQLERSPELHRQMSAAARCRAEQLAWPKVAARMMEIYRAL